MLIEKTQEMTETYTCKYCERSFKREKSLAVHLCEQKKRFNEQNERGVQIGYQAYIRFYEHTQGSAKTKTYEHFAKSPYYKAFVSFGRHCVAIRAINIPRFSDWVVKNNKKIDHWCKDSVYDEYLLDLVYNENPKDALERAIVESIAWGEEKSADPKDMLRYGNANTICYKITTGRITGWVLYNSESGRKFIEDLVPELQQMIWQYIDPERWAMKFHKLKADQIYVQEILQQAGW